MEPMSIVSFPPTAIRGNESSLVEARPIEDFQPVYLVVPKSIALDFMIVDFKIGKNCQFNGMHPVLAEVFAGEVEVRDLSDPRTLEKVPLDELVPLRLEACPRHFSMYLRVTNLNPNARNFCAVVYGTLIK